MFCFEDHDLSLLQSSILHINRRPILIPTNNKIITRRPKRNTSKHSAIPIHRLGSNRRRRWKEAKDKETDKEDQCDDVDGQTPATKTESCFGEGFPAETTREEGADGKDVGGQEGGDCEGDDCVEGDAAAEVDEGDDDAADHGDGDGVEGDVPAGGDLSVMVNTLHIESILLNAHGAE